MNIKFSPFKKLNSKYYYILFGFTLAVGIFFLFSSIYFVQNKSIEILPAEGFQKIFSPPIPGKLDLA